MRSRNFCHPGLCYDSCLQFIFITFHTDRLDISGEQKDGDLAQVVHQLAERPHPDRLWGRDQGNPAQEPPKVPLSLLQGSWTAPGHLPQHVGAEICLGSHFTHQVCSDSSIRIKSSQVLQRLHRDHATLRGREWVHSSIPLQVCSNTLTFTFTCNVHYFLYSLTWSFSGYILNHDREKFVDMLKDEVVILLSWEKQSQFLNCWWWSTYLEEKQSQTILQSLVVARWSCRDISQRRSPGTF